MVINTNDEDKKMEEVNNIDINKSDNIGKAPFIDEIIKIALKNAMLDPIDFDDDEDK